MMRQSEAGGAVYLRELSQGLSVNISRKPSGIALLRRIVPVRRYLCGRVLRRGGKMALSPANIPLTLAPVMLGPLSLRGVEAVKTNLGGRFRV